MALPPDSNAPQGGRYLAQQSTLSGKQESIPRFPNRRHLSSKTLFWCLSPDTGNAAAHVTDLLPDFIHLGAQRGCPGLEPADGAAHLVHIAVHLLHLTTAGARYNISGGILPWL